MSPTIEDHLVIVNISFITGIYCDESKLKRDKGENMPKVLYECEFCGKKFASKASCQEHEKKCDKNKSNISIKSVRFSIDFEKCEIASSVSNSVDFISGKEPLIGVLCFSDDALSAQGYFRTDEEKSKLFNEFKSSLSKTIKNLIDSKKNELNSYINFFNKFFSVDNNVEDIDQLINHLKDICENKNLMFNEMYPLSVFRTLL